MRKLKLGRGGYGARAAAQSGDDGQAVRWHLALRERLGLFIVGVLFFASTGCAHRYEANDAVRLTQEHAARAERAQVLAQARLCDAAGSTGAAAGAACAAVADAMQRAEERNDAISLYFRACELGRAAACDVVAELHPAWAEEALRIRDVRRITDEGTAARHRKEAQAAGEAQEASNRLRQEAIDEAAANKAARDAPKNAWLKLCDFQAGDQYWYRWQLARDHTENWCQGVAKRCSSVECFDEAAAHATAERQRNTERWRILESVKDWGSATFAVRFWLTRDGGTVCTNRVAVRVPCESAAAEHRYYEGTKTYHAEVTNGASVAATCWMLTHRHARSRDGTPSDSVTVPARSKREIEFTIDDSILPGWGDSSAEVACQVPFGATGIATSQAWDDARWVVGSDRRTGGEVYPLIYGGTGDRELIK
ncbi:MAG: hypothetical protein IT373_33210 [Polyangiaceae bacterium]|nr:hypothetical protein [Polyangiaceae bacterium]